MKQLLLFDTEQNTLLAKSIKIQPVELGAVAMFYVGDRVFVTDDGIRFADYHGIPEGTRGTVTHVHVEHHVTVQFDDYTPRRASANQLHEFVCFKRSLRKVA